MARFHASGGIAVLSEIKKQKFCFLQRTEGSEGEVVKFVL